MEEKVRLKIHYMVEDYVRSISFIQNRSFFVRYAFLLVPIFISILIAFLFLFNGNYNFHQILSALPPIIIIFIFLIIFKYFHNPILKWNISKQFNSSPLMQEIQFVSFTNNGISVQSEKGATETSWQAIINFIETNEDFYFFISNKFAIFVPKRSLSEEKVTIIRNLVTEKL